MTLKAANTSSVVLAEEVEAMLKASEISRDRVEDARNVLKEGDEVEAKITNITAMDGPYLNFAGAKIKVIDTLANFKRKKDQA